SGAWQTTLTVAAMLHGSSVSPDNTLHDGLIRIYGALAGNDAVKYELSREWTRPKLKNPDVRIHALHVRIADAVSGADQVALDRLMAEAIADFPARGRRRTPSLLYACGRDDNRVALDFIAAGLAKIALKRGLTVNADAPVVPRALVTWWRG